MKKLIAISILLALLSAAVFAENFEANDNAVLLPGFHVGLRASFYPDLLKITAPTGDAANDSYYGQTAATKDYYAGDGTFALLSSANTWAGMGVDMALSYKDADGNYEGLLTLNAGKWIEALFAQVYDGAYDDPTAPADGAADYYDGSKGASLLSFLNIPFGDLYIQGKVGKLTARLGNIGGGGKTSSYDDLENSYADNYTMDGFGILMPVGYNDSSNALNSAAYLNNNHGGTDPATGYKTLGTLGANQLAINDIGRTTNPWASSPGNYNNLFFLGTIDFAPIYVQVAGDLTGAAEMALRSTGDPDGGTPSTTKIGAGFRVSGDKIADLITFDAIYKVFGGDLDHDDQFGWGDGTLPVRAESYEPNASGRWDHSFGLFANLGILNDTLGIGVGYSGYVRQQEDLEYQNRTRKIIYPYFSGVDLRFQFTGVDKLKVTFNNNFSFSMLTNDDSDTTINASMMPYAFGTGANFYHTLGNYPITGNDTKIAVTQGYFGMYNALGVKYDVTEALYASFVVANQLGIFNYTDGSSKSAVKALDISWDKISGNVLAGFSFNRNVTLETGLALSLDSYTVQLKGTSVDNNANWGMFTFGIPVTFSVRF